jgi:protoheme IX farnesyltransferase
MENISLLRRIFTTVHIYADLAKYRLSLAVAFSSATGYWLNRNAVDRDFLNVSAGVFLLASGSAVLNQFIERDEDSRMGRTSNRPIPAGKVPAGSALLFSLLLMIYGGFLLLLNGPVPFALGAFCVVLYNFIYTPLKRISVFAVLPGALVGAVPPVIGWVSAGGTILTSWLLMLPAFLFLWQLPHFWLLIVRYGEEYEAAGFKTIRRLLNDKQIRYLIFAWTVLSLAFLLVVVLVMTDLKSALPQILIIADFVFIILFSRLLFLPGNPGDNRRAFLLFNSYGLFIMLALIADSLSKGISY